MGDVGGFAANIPHPSQPNSMQCDVILSDSEESLYLGPTEKLK